ncbi:MAG TPA: hypothetical protein PLD27_09400 [bacterium]|nr:hypothetical protein [bacterium]HOL48226.1 hypothetical protein [bacterium]HPQ20011.1 hypothetical protein [bacterium]
MNKLTNKYLGEILIELGFIEKDDLNDALKEQEYLKEKNISILIGELLIQRGLITEEQLNAALEIFFSNLVNNPDTEPFLKSTANLALETIKGKNSGIEKTVKKQKAQLSSEGKYAIVYRINLLNERMQKYYKSIERLKQMKNEKITTMGIKNYEKQINDIKEKIKLLKEDLENFE